MVWLPPTGAASSPPEEVADSELLARSVHSNSGFTKGLPGGDSGRVKFRAFDPQRDPEDPSRRVRTLSVDRCEYLTESSAIALAHQRAVARKLPFYGWAIINAENVRKCGCDVESSEPEGQDNPAHADIILPADAAFDDQARNRHLVQLADNSCWLTFSL